MKKKPAKLWSKSNLNGEKARSFFRSYRPAPTVTVQPTSLCSGQPSQEQLRND